jgi:hypothetical protein
MYKRKCISALIDIFDQPRQFQLTDTLPPRDKQNKGNGQVQFHAVFVCVSDFPPKSESHRKVA